MGVVEVCAVDGGEDVTNREGGGAEVADEALGLATDAQLVIEKRR